MPSTTQLDAIFSPRSIAVIGASKKPGTIGNQVLKNLIDGGYEGALYAVNPTATEILGQPVFATVNDIPGDVDMAVFCVPEKLCQDVAEQCAHKGVKGFVVITSGFSECGNTAGEKQLVETALAAGGRVIGPNVVGVLLNACKANASFAPMLPYAGKTALISQSGALLIALDMATFVRRLGVSSMISLGNMADVDFADCIEYYAQDPNTGCIALYIEGLKHGRKFIEAGRKSGKPIIALKAGVSAHGAAAAASHTGSLAGAVAIYDAAFKQAHVIRALDLDQLLDCSQALAMQPPMRGENIVVITNGGGIGVLASDSAEARGVPLRTVPPELQAEFRKCMPEFGSPRNPVDITGGAGIAGYERAIDVALRSDRVDGVAVLYCETAVTRPAEIADAIIAQVANTGVSGKPVIACFVGGNDCAQAAQRFADAGIPMYEDPDKALSAMAALRQVARFEEENGLGEFVPFPDVDQVRARQIIRQARRAGRTALTEPESKELFMAYGLPVADSQTAHSPEEAVSIAHHLGYPIVMKIVSPQILHKSEAGGVKVNIRTAEGVREAFQTIKDNAFRFRSDAEVHGVLVQEMAPLGREVIVGSINDPAFGPTVMFGLGGIFVEVLKDVTFRVAPISKDIALKMFPEIRSYPILRGSRGEKALDQCALASVVSRLSQLVSELGDEIAETDANPIMLYEDGKGLKIVDARVILRRQE